MVLIQIKLVAIYIAHHHLQIMLYMEMSILIKEIVLCDYHVHMVLIMLELHVISSAHHHLQIIPYLEVIILNTAVVLSNSIANMVLLIIDNIVINKIINIGTNNQYYLSQKTKQII